MKRRFLAAAASAATIAAGAATLTAGSSPAGAIPSITQAWADQLPRTQGIVMSSPTVATLDSGGPAAVVGDRSGHIYAVHLSNGSEVPGWPVNTGGVVVDSPPSTALGLVFVGLGTTGSNMSGGNAAYRANGTRVWLRTPPGGGAVADVAGMAAGNLQGQTDVVSGSLSQYAVGYNAGSGATLAGWPFGDADSNFTTPAIADLYSNGHNEVIEGGDSTQPSPVFNDQFGQPYLNGGHIRVISGTGAPICEYNVHQVVQGSPAVGRFLAGGGVGIVAGTGNYYPNTANSGTDQVLATNTHCGLVWASPVLDGVTSAAPAIVNALGNGGLQIAEGTHSASDANVGSAYLLNGATGGVIWRTPLLGGVIGGLASVDLGGGYQDIVAATTGGVEILDGKTGAVVWQALHGTLAMQNAPLVTQDPNGRVGITVAGYNSKGGAIYHFEVAEAASRATESGSWPMFHHDAQLTGDAGTPPPKSINVPCKAPTTTPSGYWLTATDGGVFTFGNLPFCGSTGGIALNKPIVGIAGTPSAGGYWLVATDGGIFSFGNAAFHGSTGSLRLRQPIVGMAPTKSGNGYWLVASDGGIFSFGDARFHGSTGSLRLRQPIVGMARTPDGGGYWLVASDGGIFSFGDAHFHGSTGSLRLRKPIVGMASTPSGNGYWLVASDGGIFSFGDAHFMGGTGSLRLTRPIVGMHTNTTGTGYWLVASDGGIFTFGKAPFKGSTGSLRLAKPIVSMMGY